MIKEGIIQLNTLDKLSDLLIEHVSNGYVLLEGPLGSGKTTFIKHLLKKLGVTEPVTSPTYTLVHTYHATLGQIMHADLYRIQHQQELEGLDLEYTGNNLLFIEWGERFAKFFTPVKAKISLSLCKSKNENSRYYSFELFSKVHHEPH
jgi:tRNA threonylcarbamoyladenosine biosynthesis protein TsaE